jgi:hypothetical protein
MTMYGFRNLLYWTLDDSNSPARRMRGLHLGDKPSAMPIPMIRIIPRPRPRPTPRPMFMSVDGAGTPIEGMCVGEKEGPDGLGVGAFDGIGVGCPKATSSAASKTANNKADLLANEIKLGISLIFWISSWILIKKIDRRRCQLKGSLDN